MAEGELRQAADVRQGVGAQRKPQGEDVVCPSVCSLFYGHRLDSANLNVAQRRQLRQEIVAAPVMRFRGWGIMVMIDGVGLRLPFVE